MTRILVTGGLGFIGSAVCRRLVADGDAVVNVDKMTYAASPEAVAAITAAPAYRFEKADIGDADAMARIFAAHQPDAVIHLAAESHVDRSIDGPAPFIDTNIRGTYVLLEAVRAYLAAAPAGTRGRFRFVHVSTDEVYGSLGPTGAFSETTAYDPRSPYSASKAASDHLVSAWHHSFGVPALISNCSNNYGPWQFPEKLFPLMIANALEGKELPVYGAGDNVRDWLYVEDHADALVTILRRGRVGESYNVGGEAEVTNIDVVRRICAELDRLEPNAAPHERLIRFVADRPGHDKRYAMDISKIGRELDWRPRETFTSGLARTIAWYRDNRAWWRAIRDRRYGGERLGLKQAGA